MKSLPCSLAGQPVELHAFDGKQARLLSTRALAPGQPLRLEIPVAPACTLDLKSLGSVKQPDGRFEVRVRALSMPREVRTQLLALFAPRE
jgi:hypothetical protein